MDKHMKILKKIKVLYKEYTVEETVNLHDNGGDLYGQIHYLPEKILLNTDASEEQRKASRGWIRYNPAGIRTDRT